MRKFFFLYQMVAARNALRNGDAQQMAEEIEKYIEEYRSSNGVIESCRCIRNIMDVFYKNSNNDMLINFSESNFYDRYQQDSACIICNVT
ncbi:MAG: hypothetical protein V8R46_02565 [Eubacterium ramulus]